MVYLHEISKQVSLFTVISSFISKETEVSSKSSVRLSRRILTEMSGDQATGLDTKKCTMII